MAKKERAGLIEAFLRQEAAGGMLLVAAAAVAITLANSPLASAYAALLHLPIGPLSTELWINDGLMALFFLTVGLEIKREMAMGALGAAEARRLPVIAAMMGMVVPALVYIAVAGRTAGAAHGWAIPAATDIAFAQAVLAFAGRGQPRSIALFLTTIAIVDDIGAILIIALAYTAHIDWLMLGFALALVVLLFALNRFHLVRIAPYLIVGALLWVALYRSGVHATMAGVVTALFVPMRGGALERLEGAVHPWSAYLIIPLFGLANAGLDLSGLSLARLTMPITLAVALGLFVGKQLGVGLGTLAALRSGAGQAPEAAHASHLHGVSLLAGIGFTMSLFIGGLAFPDPARFAEVKLGVLAGSLASAIAGFLILRRAGARAPLPLPPSQA